MDLGKHGNTFEIAEDDMLEYIQNRLSYLEKTGGIEKHQLEIKKNAEQYVNRPTPINGLSVAKEKRSWVYDPTYILKDDILDHNNNILHRAGTVVNPLDSVELPQNLIFIDGDDEVQVDLAFDLLQKSEKPLKIILTSGSPVEIMKAKGIQVYFDQKGILVKKLGLEKVPSLIEQKDHHLLITELVVNES